jgi:hypothetical protein
MRQPKLKVIKIKYPRSGEIFFKMNIKIFTIPITDDGAAQEEMNGFE